ncbi:Alpha/Beta hydrolase protein [Mortierella sp. GBAus27b]|nr:hypothetical protein BGX31_000564 [Mortierella sp. GBA43]KAI8349077.1 Alpha/Beta hydrolase protein [Mortierella sp. GBAus27b]
MSEDDHRPQIILPGYGTIQGAKDQHRPVARFLNIPFGTVEQRWKPAVRPQPWAGVRDASNQGPMPPQEIIDGPSPFLLETLETCIGSYENLYDETNCLNLNIFMPTQGLAGTSSGLDDLTINTKNLPVLVWVYGGALRRGGNGVCLFDVTNFVARSIAIGKPVIVVVPNYRVNYLGFISSKELQEDALSSDSTHPHGPSIGNWGLQDITLALEWVHSHIHLFSGDVTRITVAGESAGAVCVNDLMQIKVSQTLFQRAILQSGSSGMLPPMSVEQDGQLYFDHLWKKFGATEDGQEVDARKKVEILRRVPAKELAEELRTYEVTFFRPTIDGILIKDDLWTKESRSGLDQGLQWVLAGCCRDEGTLLAPILGADTVEKFSRLRSRLCPPSSFQAFDRLYGVPKTDAEATAISSRLINDGFFRFPMHRTSQLVLESGSCYLSRYHFDCSLSKILKDDPTVGAHHGSDLLFMFGSDATLEHLTEEEKVLAGQMQEIWIEFVSAADPTQSSIPRVRAIESHESGTDTVPSGDHSSIDELDASNQAIWFKEDLTVGKTVVERMTDEELVLWKDAFEYHIQERARGRSDVGFNTFSIMK